MIILGHLFNEENNLTLHIYMAKIFFQYLV